MMRYPSTLGFYLVLAGIPYSHTTVAVDYLEMGIEELMQISVTGSTLKAESLKTVPTSVTVFTRVQLERLGIDYLYELVNLVPGYQFTRTADRSAGYTMSARGRRNSTDAREILLLVDGRIFVDPRSGSADASLPLFPLDQIEKVEIMRGPGSALYGSSAFSGVINVITRRGENSIQVTGGSQQRLSARTLWSHTDDTWEFNFYGRAYEDKGDHNVITDRYSTSPTPSTDPRRSLDVDANLRHHNTQFHLAYHRLDTEDFYVAERIRNGFNEGVQLLQQIGFEHPLHLTDAFKTTLRFGYLEASQTLSGLVFPPNYLVNMSEPASQEPLLVHAEFESNGYRLSFANDWTISKDSSLQFGVNLHERNQKTAHAFNNFNLGQFAQGDLPVTYYGDFTHSTQLGEQTSQSALGIYAQFLHELSAETRLTMGVRYDAYNLLAEHLSPRLGLVHQLTSNQTLKLLYGTAYRAPSFSETALMNNPVLVGNPSLVYEEVQTLDFIWMGAWQNTQLTINGFRNDYHYPISTGFIDTTRTYINGDDEHSSGIELEANQHLTGQWLLRATYTHFLSLPDTAFREAEQLASVMVNYERGPWNWNFAGIYQGERELVITDGVLNQLPSYWLANSKLSYALSDQHKISMQVKNVLDKDYRTPPQGAGIPLGVINRGRELSLGFDWRFR